MKNRLIYAYADVWYTSHAGFTFVVPLPGGRLDSLAREVSIPGRTRLAGWCFTDPHPGLPNHVMCGTYRQGDEFVQQCEQLGLFVAHVTNVDVPFTGGVRVGRTDADELGYFPSEYAAVRQDLPTREQLAELARVR